MYSGRSSKSPAKIDQIARQFPQQQRLGLPCHQYREIEVAFGLRDALNAAAKSINGQ
jgi:hypothetical protein